MIALAPGKLVLSGAYAVLEGAPAIVAAIDRYVSADASRPADLVTKEVETALSKRPSDRAPWFDASALRTGGQDDRKLGLGSSAAILVASLAALELLCKPHLTPPELAALVLAPALAAHREAQGGGSGIDVVASALGGVQCCTVTARGPDARAVTLPSGLVIEAWSSANPAATSGMLKKVAHLRARVPRVYTVLVSELASAAEAAEQAVDANAFLQAAERQLEGLARLGREAGAPIVTRENATIARLAEPRRAVVLPSGAGGGDVVLWMGQRPSDQEWRMLAERSGFRRLEVVFGARGVYGAASADPPR